MDLTDYQDNLDNQTMKTPRMTKKISKIGSTDYTDSCIKSIFRLHPIQRFRHMPRVKTLVRRTFPPLKTYTMRYHERITPKQTIDDSKKFEKGCKILFDLPTCQTQNTRHLYATAQNSLLTIDVYGAKTHKAHISLSLPPKLVSKLCASVTIKSGTRRFSQRRHTSWNVFGGPT